MPTGLESNAVTFIPYTGKFYVGALENNNMNFQGRSEKNYEVIAVLHKGKLAKHRQANTQGWIHDHGYNRLEAVEFVNKEMVRQADRARKYQSATGNSHNLQAAIDNTSLANITRVELLTEIINRQYKDTFLIEAVRKIPVPKLKLDYDIMLHVRPNKDARVPKRQKPNVENPEFVQAKFDLAAFGKLSRMIDVADEDELTALISPSTTAIDDISQVISQDENLLIKNTMKEFSDVAAPGTWDVRTGDFSDNNPLDDISKEIERIAGSPNHGRPNIFVSNLTDLGKYLSNSHLIGFTNAIDREGQGIGTLPGFPGLKRVTDVDIDANNVFLYDQRALTYGEGPMVSESFRDPQRAVSGHVIRKWVEPLIETTLKTAFGTELTGVST